MTVSSTVRTAGPFQGNGAATSFAFAFKVFATTDITVVLTNAAGAQTTLVLGTDYTVTLNADQNGSPGGTVTYPASAGAQPLQSGYTLFINSNVPATQQTSLPSVSSPLLPSTVEDALDKTTILSQQAEAAQARQLSVPVGDAATALQLPAAALRAGMVLGFDANGNVQVLPAGSGYTATAAGITINGPAGAVSLQTAAGDFSQNESVTAGSVMWIDHLMEYSTFPLKSEAGIWSGDTYTYYGFSKEMNSGTVGGGTAGGGPLTTLFAFANNNGAVGDVVAILGDAVARQSNGVVFGGNLIARNVAGTANTKLVGLELDVEPATGTTDAVGSIGLALNIFSIASNATAGLVAGVGGGTWANGFGTSHIRGAHYYVNSGDPTTASSFISTINGTFSNGAIQLGQGAAQSVNFGGGSFGVSPYLYGDNGGNLQLNMGTGGFFEINNPAGAQRFTFDQYGALNMPNNGAIKINSVQVLAQQITGYGTPTGNVKTANFPGATATLLQTSEMLAQLIIDLKSHGLIGA